MHESKDILTVGKDLGLMSPQRSQKTRKSGDGAD